MKKIVLVFLMVSLMTTIFPVNILASEDEDISHAYIKTKDVIRSSLDSSLEIDFPEKTEDIVAHHIYNNLYRIKSHYYVEDKEGEVDKEEFISETIVMTNHDHWDVIYLNIEGEVLIDKEPSNVPEEESISISDEKFEKIMNTMFLFATGVIVYRVAK